MFEAANILQTIVQERKYTIKSTWTDSKNVMNVVIQIGGSLLAYPSLVDATLEGNNIEKYKATKIQITQAKNDSTDCYLAMCFILVAEIFCFGDLIEDHENQHTQGMKAFPSTLSSTFEAHKQL